MPHLYAATRKNSVREVTLSQVLRSHTDWRAVLRDRDNRLRGHGPWEKTMRATITLFLVLCTAMTSSFGQIVTDAYGNADPNRKAHARDDFSYLTQINKASLVMLRETRIVPDPVALRLAKGIDSVTECNGKPGAERPRDYLKYE